MYLDLVRPEAAVLRRQYDAAPAPAPADFDSTEWRVVRLARTDGLGSLAPRGPITRWLRSLLGLAETNPLADPRLETLRHVAVQLWHARRSASVEQTDRLVAAGFTLSQVALLVRVCAA